MDEGNPEEEVQRDLTNKFISGELSFTDYSEQWADEAFQEENYELQKEEIGESSTSEVVLDDDSITERKRVRGPRKMRRTLLPLALKGLMGEANLRYARNQKDMAEKMCYEIIRQVPTASEPFETLAQIYEADKEKSLQFSLIAAHLNPSDAEMWLRLASLTAERGDICTQVICLTKAIAAQPENVSYHLARLDVIKRLEENNTLASSIHLTSSQCYMRLIRCLPQSEGAQILSIAKNVAKSYHTDNKIDKALMAMDIAYSKVPSLFLLEDINLYLELLLGRKQHEKCLNIFVAKCNIEVEAEVQTVLCDEHVEEITTVLNCSLPANLPVDLRSKLIVCLIHMKAFHLIEPLLDNLIKNEDVEVIGDLYLDIEEALTQENRHTEALSLLESLVKSEKFSLAAVWLKYAECLIALNRENDAIGPLKTVIELAPQHLKARLILSDIFKRENRFEEALIALEQNEETQLLDTGLLYDRCLMLKSKNDYESFLKVGKLLLSRHFYKIRNKMEIVAFRIKDTFEYLRAIREAREEEVEDVDEINFDESSNRPTLEQEWEILMDLFKICQEHRHNALFQRLSFSALGSKRFSGYKHKLEYITILASLQNKDYNNAYFPVKDLVLKYPDKNRIWNLFNLIIQKKDDTRHVKFVVRALKKLNQDESYNIFIANNQLISGSYRSALQYYLTCYNNKNSALLALLTGITLTHIACQKFTSNKNSLVVQGLAFMDLYEKLRGDDGLQEVYYNIGRVYHQLGLFSYATQYYKKALEVNCKVIHLNDNILNLQKEIAFNLHLIYVQDSPLLAQYYLEKYLIV